MKSKRRKCEGIKRIGEAKENLDLELQEFHIVDDLIQHRSLVGLSFHKFLRHISHYFSPFFFNKKTIIIP